MALMAMWYFLMVITNIKPFNINSYKKYQPPPLSKSSETVLIITILYFMFVSRNRCFVLKSNRFLTIEKTLTIQTWKMLFDQIQQTKKPPQLLQNEGQRKKKYLNFSSKHFLLDVFPSLNYNSTDIALWITFTVFLLFV